MASRGAVSPLIEVPSPEADSPSWRTIGIIAAVGFVVGVAWPRLAGVRIGPSLPDAVPSASSVAGASEPTPDAPAASAGPSLSTQVAAPSDSARPVSDDPRAPAGAVAPAPSAMPSGYRAAQVEWAVAIVRDAPREGKVIARLQRATALRVGSPKGGWYPVQFGDGFSSEGWVYRGAIGR